MTLQRLDLPPLLQEEHTDDRATIRLTVEYDGAVVASVESNTDPMRSVALYGGEALLIWLQATSEAGLSARHRLMEQEAA